MASTMRFRSITRHISRNCYDRSSLLKLQRYRFSSNIDNDKNNIASAKSRKNATLHKVSKLQQSIKTNLKRMKNESLWSLIALDDEHKQWIHKYNQTLAKHQTAYYNIQSFKDLSKYIGYIGSIGFDAIQRMRMRPLKATLLCYEEFMFGALHSFKAIQNMDPLDSKRLSQCFTPALTDNVKEIKNALFDTDDDANRYSIGNINLFGASLYFKEKAAQSRDVPDVEMHFSVRYYYTLQDMQNEMDLNHKYADLEWIGSFVPEIEEGRFKALNLSDQGFQISEIRVEDF